MAEDAAMAAWGLVRAERLLARRAELDAQLAAARADPAGHPHAFSSTDCAARARIVDWAQSIGLAPISDQIGNLYLRRTGEANERAPVLVGGHLDPVEGGFGRASQAARASDAAGPSDPADASDAANDFAGFGVLAGIEALEAIAEAGVTTQRPIEVVLWANGDGRRFAPPMMGSAFFCGELSFDDLLKLEDADGGLLSEAVDALLGCTPQIALRPTGFEIFAHLEAHIEPGPTLRRQNKTIGVVTKARGLRRFEIDVRGEAAHAGATPRSLRQDAFQAAVNIISTLQSVADGDDELRLTVDRFEIESAQSGIVPARVCFEIDSRHEDPGELDHISAAIRAACRTKSGACVAALKTTAERAPTPFSPDLIDIITEQTAALKLSGMRMISGAQLDAISLARVCPSAVVAIASGRERDVEAGARVLTASLLELANR